MGDEVVREPLGGAHREPQAMAEMLKAALVTNLAEIEALPAGELLERRHARLRAFGIFGQA